MKYLFIALALASGANAYAQSDSIRLNDVVVTGTRSATTTRNLPMTVSVVDRSTLTENQRISILPTLTEQIPGLFITQRGVMGYGVSNGAAGGINLRGVSSGNGQLLVLIDGKPQYNGIYGHSIADAYQTMMAERVEVLRGPSSVLYGSNAMGGVINIVTRGMQQDGVRTHVNLGAGSWGTVQGEVNNQVRAGKFSSTIAGQYSRSDNHRPRMGFEQYGGYAKVGYDFNEHWNTFADIDLTHFKSSYPGTESNPMFEADQWITRGNASFSVENNYNHTSGRISVYHNWGNHKINDGYGPKENRKIPQTDFFRSKDALTGISFYQNAKPWQGGFVTLGFDYQHIYGKAWYTDRNTDEVVKTSQRLMQSCDENVDELAVYADMRQDVFNWLTLDAGVRFDRHTVSGNEWIPQAGIVIRPMQSGEVKLMASKGFRNPNVKEMYLYGSANDELLPERLWNYELSWRQRLCDDRIVYGVNLFINNGDNMIQTVNRKNINTGEIRNRGAELEATWKSSNHLTFSTNHSFLHMKYPVLGAPEYKGYVGANIRFGKWAYTIGLQQLCGLYTMLGNNNTSDKKTCATLLNATVTYQLMPMLQLWLKGDNILAQDYETISGYPMPRATFMGGVNICF